MDVDTDFHQFYLKFVENSNKITRDSKLALKQADAGLSYYESEMQESRVDKSGIMPIKFIVRKANHFWRNRISMSTVRSSKQAGEWEFIIDKRVSRFYKPYSHFLNFSNLMLLAHRNMLSIYNMSANEDTDDFVENITFKEGYVR